MSVYVVWRDLKRRGSFSHVQLTSEISNIDFTHPFKDFIQPEVSGERKVREKEFFLIL